MVRSAATLIAREGLRATGVRDVADDARAPRGSIRHYFPGGKTQLVRESLTWIGDSVAVELDRPLRSTGPTSGVAVGVLETFVQLWVEGLVATGISSGCSVAAVVHDSDDETLRSCAAEVFDHWRRPFRRALRLDGASDDVADALATTTLAALEGAVILCRAQRDLVPLEQTASALRYLLLRPPGALPGPSGGGSGH